MTSRPEHLHVTRSGTLSLPLPLDRASSLFSPEGERDWVPGWEPEYLHLSSSQSAPASPATQPPLLPGTIFRTRHGGEETLWLVLDYATVPAATRAEYVRVTPGSRMGTVTVEGRAVSATTSEFTVTYRLTALSPEGNAHLADMTSDAYAAMLREWEVAIVAAIAAHG